ncbi:hypothetical protein RclHR1_00100007 [Rhizophagus clarus]|uniref:F-box domain-containing protein n=1 Tax=Rhizophagus clarus TaxID=94130 RepID=A0A2Z6Q0C3_9GLOM|nr:hypothetical protein RclHR1_00100007 [Rhizophagus clarus]GES75677.1 hypothetical protein GLOIN_2v1791592 [Rhizophagus clarus]
MTSPYLPDDCIYDILKFLQDCHSTLFNCSLVNRFWCKATVPLLYANPFIKQNKSIILTLIPCFDKFEMKNQLNFFGIDNIREDYKPLFEYPKYLKVYDYSLVNSTILRFLYNQYQNQNQYQRNKLIEIGSMFHQLILYHGINIEKFNVNVEFINFFSPYYNVEIVNKFLDNVSSIHCLNLKELKIYSMSQNKFDVAKKFCEIIQKQNNLEKFTISRYLFNNIFSSLEFQKHSLNSIEFLFIDLTNISLKNFINLYKLKCLKFYNCKDTSPLDRYEILKFASFKLRKLEFSSNTWNENIEPTIIKYLGTSLQGLSLNDKLTISTVDLITLEITIVYGRNKINYSLIFSHFKNLRIRKLNINVISSHHHDISEMFMNIAGNLSTNVKEISFKFFSHYIHMQSCIKKFFENCHNYLEKINLNSSYLIRPEFFKIILNYIESGNNNLTILSLNRKKVVLNDEVVKLLEEIKVKGVKIIVDH